MAETQWSARATHTDLPVGTAASHCHRLTTELPLPLAFLRGLAGSSILLLLGLIQNESPRAAVPPQAWLMFNTAFLFLIGMMAFGYAWTWAGMEWGPYIA